MGGEGAAQDRSLDFASSCLFIIHKQPLRETAYVWASDTSKRGWVCVSVNTCMYAFILHYMGGSAAPLSYVFCWPWHPEFLMFYL